MSQQTQEPKGKQCTRCGHTIFWNNNSRFFEDKEFPKFQHCCPLPCNKEGCGGTIYFSNLCPKNTQTGRAIPLDLPVPQVDPKDPSKMIWIIHNHKNTIPAETPTAPTDLPPELKAIQKPPVTATLAEGQETLEYKPEIAAPQVIPEQVKRPELVAQVANKDVSATLIQAINDISQRLGELERLTNEELVPAIKELVESMNATLPKLQVIVGKIADGSITSASDLVQHNLNERQEQNLQ